MDQSQQTTAAPPGRIDAILADFELLDDWEDRYRYVIELGRTLEPLPDDARNAANKVQGCVSQVWLATTPHRDGRNTSLTFIGDSDAHIVRGLIAILLSLYSGLSADDILKIDANALLNGQSSPTGSPRRYRSSNSWDRLASIRRTSRRFPFVLGITMPS